MPRSISPTAIQEINAVHSGEVWVWLMEIIHIDITTIFVCNNNVSVTSNAQLYEAYPFDIVLNTDDGRRFPTIQLQIENIDRSLVDEILLVSSALTVNLKLVMASNPNIVEIEVPNMTLKGVSFDESKISGELVIDDILNARYPRDTMDSEQYAGLY